MKASTSPFSALHVAVALTLLASWASPIAHAVTQLSFGQATSGSINAAGQVNKYSLIANTGDVVDLTMAATSGNLNPLIQLYTSEGTLIQSASNYYEDNSCYPSSTVEMNTVTLPASPGNTYFVLISDCAATNTGDYGLYAQRTNNPSGGSIMTLGTASNTSISSASQSSTFTFNGIAGDVLDFTLSTSGFTPKIRVYNPDGSQLGAATVTYQDGSCYPTATVELNTLKLPSTGAFTVLIGDCGDTATGTYSVYAQSTKSPVGAAGVLWGELQSGAISTAQSNTFVFDGTANDVLSFTVSTSGYNPKLRVYNPDGSELVTATTTYQNGACYPTSTLTLSNLKLSEAGNYTVLIGACDDTSVGTYNVSPQCFGTCLLPSPGISSISPASTLIGSSGFTLTVNGSNFVEANAQSIVQWNGSDLATTWVNTGKITAQVPASALATARNIPVTVFTPTPGGGTSSSANFTVYNPAPGASIVLAPSSEAAGSSDTPLIVTGTNFVPTSSVLWNGSPLATTYINAGKLTATIPAADLSVALDCGNVTVSNPAVPGGQPAGGGISSPQCFTIVGPPALTGPASGTILGGPTTFTWNQGGGSTEFQVYVGATGPGSHDIYAGPDQAGTATSSASINIPLNGATVYVRLWYLMSSAWKSVDYTYTEATPPSMSAPNPGSTIGGPNTFTWNAGMGVSKFQVYIGTTETGSGNVYMGPDLAASTTSSPSINIPANGVTLYVRLWYLVNSAWLHQDYTYTEKATPPSITSPSAGTLLGGPTTFTWNPGAPSATEFQLYIGTTGAGSADLYRGPDIPGTSTSSAAISLPIKGATLYVRFWFLLNSAWQHQDYTYTEATPPSITSPSAATPLGGPTRFTWNPGAGVSKFQVYVGTTGAGSGNVYMGPDLAGTVTSSASISVPAQGATIYVRLWYLIGSTWQHEDTTYTEATAPSMSTPAPGSTIGSPTAFTWNPGTGATGFQIYVGTTGAGSHNDYQGPDLSGSVTSSPSITFNVPSGATLNVRLWYLMNGSWLYQDYTYTKAP